MRKRIAALLLGLAVVSLAACGRQKADTKTETKKETEAGSEKATENEKAAESEKATEAAAASGETVKIKIGATPSPHAEILEAAKDALKITFSRILLRMKDRLMQTISSISRIWMISIRKTTPMLFL